MDQRFDGAGRGDDEALVNVAEGQVEEGGGGVLLSEMVEGDGFHLHHGEEIYVAVQLQISGSGNQCLVT